MDSLKPGDHLDNFQIREVLHPGAMAFLYRAVDLLYGDEVVLKVPIADILNNPIPYYHYQNEERISRYLNHPRIVRFLARERSRHYLVMEYIAGCDLRRLFGKRKKLPFSRVRHFAIQVAEALEYLHGLSIVHLDLKPENIMITREDDIKVFDFGMAFHGGHLDLLAEDFQAPQGTPYYISPEQLCGRRDDNRSDFYSFGILLYEMLTGRLPFKRTKKLSKVKARLKQDPVPPRYYDPEIVPEIQEIILKCLERDPDERYQTAAELRADLLEYKKIRVTNRGRLTTKPSLWPTLLKSANLTCRIYTSRPAVDVAGRKDRSILGCIVDHEISDLVIDRIRREVLTHGGEVTLLTVHDRDQDTDLEKYALQVEGEQFSKRLDRYVNKLKQYDINPTIRIKSGDIATVIEETARRMKADLIVLGPPLPKKGLAGIFSGSVLQKILTKAICTVVVAEAVSPGSPPLFKSTSDLHPDILMEVDLFLIDTWVHHLNWLTELISVLLRDPTSGPDLDKYSCSLGKWLDELSQNPTWLELVGLVSDPHAEFHDIARHMSEKAAEGDMRAMRDLYMTRALPLSTEMKIGLQRMSSYLHLKSKLENE